MVKSNSSTDLAQRPEVVQQSRVAVVRYGWMLCVDSSCVGRSLMALAASIVCERPRRGEARLIILRPRRSPVESPKTRPAPCAAPSPPSLYNRPLNANKDFLTLTF